MVQFVAAITEAPPPTLEGSDVQRGVTDTLLTWLLAAARAFDRGVRYRACQLLQSIITALPESYELSDVRCRNTLLPFTTQTQAQAQACERAPGAIWAETGMVC